MACRKALNMLKLDMLAVRIIDRRGAGADSWTLKTVDKFDAKKLKIPRSPNAFRDTNFHKVNGMRSGRSVVTASLMTIRLHSKGSRRFFAGIERSVSERMLEALKFEHDSSNCRWISSATSTRKLWRDTRRFAGGCARYFLSSSSLMAASVVNKTG
ncbi:hypothetical protein SCHPADRAFT_519538 [Schizopora paradoxa]|uniref:Uncharacterized protein n=1 Tax=Schizopora paradoxa TaxID=27342 RepID=A0A0H2RFX8_9AGAM|nr:hypothetical protein SCHPADRAFT_519538 [Schizopora paradoxa]